MTHFLTGSAEMVTSGLSAMEASQSRGVPPVPHMRVVAIAILLAGAAMITGCRVRPEQPETVHLTWRKPVLKPLSQTASSQEKGGVRITLAPPLYEATKTYEIQDTRVPDKPFPRKGHLYNFDRRKMPKAVVTPDRLQFVVKVNNRMNRVFRGQGAVVSFNVDSRQIALNQADYASLLNLVLPPQAEGEVVIDGPPLGSLPDHCTIAISFYDVVIEKDQSGTVKKLENWEWFYDYSVELRSEDEQVTVEHMEMISQQPR